MINIANVASELVCNEFRSYPETKTKLSRDLIPKSISVCHNWKSISPQQEVETSLFEREYGGKSS